MFSSPDNEKSLTETAKTFAKGEEQLGIARGFYEGALLPAIRKKGPEMTPTRLRELISIYEKEHQTKVNSIALENIAAESIAKGKGSSIKWRKKAGEIIQEVFNVPPETFRWKIILFGENR